MNVTSIPCLSDNYAYLIVCKETNQAGIVDPSEAGPVLDAVQRSGADLVAILNTHHHWDHIGGNKELLQRYPSLKVYGHGSDKGRIDGQTRFLDADESFTLGKLEFLVVHEAFLRDLASHAHVALPATTFAERDGTYTSFERRVQRVRRAIEPMGEARPAWQVVCEIARKMGAEGFD